MLLTALELLEREDGPVVLADFPDEAPLQASPDDAGAWSCPVSFRKEPEGEPELVREVLAEISRLAPWHEMYVARGGRAATPACPLSHPEVVRGPGPAGRGR